MVNQIGKIPEFTQDEPATEVKNEEAIPQETLPLEEKPVEEPIPAGAQEAVKPEGEAINEDTSVLKSQLSALEAQKKAILDEIVELRGQRRTLKEAELGKVEAKIEKVQEEIPDVNPDDVRVIEKIARARGFISKDDVNKMFYEKVKQEVIDDFLNKYPEFKPENDPNDAKWNALQKEVSWYKMPENPRMIATLLDRARKVIVPTGEQNTTTVKKQLSTASIGSQGVQRSSQVNPINPDLRANLHGFDEEDIKKISKRLNK